MSSLITLALAASTLLAPLATADNCDLTNALAPNTDYIETDTSYCRGQGAGSYTFAMATQFSTLGIPNTISRVGPSPSNVQTYGFTIMDNTCKVLGVYEAPGCGVPYEIRDSYLPYELIIDHIDAGEGEGYFEFRYANGKYSIGNNG